MLNFLFPDMSIRSTEKELMDLPDTDLHRLIRTIRQFKLLNRIFSSSRILIKRHFFCIMEQHPKETYSMLDIGAGGCDIEAWTVKEARRRHLSLTITALEKDKRIMPVAAETVKKYPEIKLVQGLASGLAHMGQFDFIFSNHFLHHLEWEEIEEILKLVRNHTVRAFVMNDLRRSYWSYIGYSVFAGLLLRKSLAFYDGRLSIRRGFMKDELEALADGKLDIGIEVRKVFPARLIISANLPLNPPEGDLKT